MKRHFLAVALGGLIALPAFANYELYGNGIAPAVAPSTKSREQVRAELVAAQRAGQVVVNAELGTLAREPVQLAGKTRDRVRAELIAAQRAGDVIVNAELGLTAREMYPRHYAQRTREHLGAGLRLTGR